MHFSMIDRVVERGAERAVAFKHVSNAEEYLLDHFPGFPVLPGVLMIEAMAQAARLIMSERVARGLVPDAAESDHWVLCQVRALKYGRFVRPGEALRVDVTFVKASADGEFEFKGEGTVAVEPGAADHRSPDANADVAVSGRFALRRPVFTQHHPVSEA